MKFKIRLVTVTDDGHEDAVEEIAVLEKQNQRLEHLGLSLTESKGILRHLQQAILQAQVSCFLAIASRCEAYQAPLKTKGHHSVAFRTLFGKVSLSSPRLYRCRSRSHQQATFSPLTALLPQRTSPELLLVETKWASLVSSELTVKALNDFLPVDEKLSAKAVQTNVLAVAERCEAELGEERVFFIDGCPRDWEALPKPEGPITVGIDGGYLRHWENKKTNFEVIVGKSVPTDRAAKCFGFVQN